MKEKILELIFDKYSRSNTFMDAMDERIDKK